MTTLEREVVEIKARVEYLEAMVRQLVGKVRQVVPAASDEPLALEQLLARCKAEGVVRDPTPEECCRRASGTLYRRRKSKPISVPCSTSIWLHR